MKLLLKHGQCITNAYALEEAHRNLELKDPKALRHLEALSKEIELIPSLVTDLEIELKMKDVPILGGAIAGHATHLLTGDEQDFGVYFSKIIQGVKVVSPRMLAGELVQRGLL